MHRAIKIAKDAISQGEVPIGAVIVDENDNVIAEAHNLTETLNDPTAHAEILAIRQAAKILQTPRLNNCTIYVTLEPCPMCAQAISFARLKAIYYGAEDVKGGGVDNGAHIYNSSSCHHKPDVYSGIHEYECATILKQFFKEKR
jgi:tRNA(Arg) A34 adenosine deaminase TadA